MIDTNIFDKLISDSFFPDIWDALATKLIEFNTTEIQETELNKISDPNLKRLLNGIPRRVIPLTKAEVKSDFKHRNDLLIAQTAAESCDLFITEDKSFQEWYKIHYPDNICFSYQEFLAWFLRDIFSDTDPF